MEFIDTHSHLYVQEFNEDLSEVISRARKAGVSKIFMPNIDCSTISSMLEVASLYENYCFPMIGLHPTSIDENYKDSLSKMKKMLENTNSFVGIGEVGLDLYWDKKFQKQQETAFEIQINWALKYNFPLIIHCREAFERMYNIMSFYIKEKSLRGIFHSFTGAVEEAEKLLEFENFKLGINGVVTFKKSLLPETLKNIPLNRIVLETDSPYLTPVPNRGKRNESANVKDVLFKVSSIYEETQEEVAKQTTQNALEVFRNV